MLDWKERQYSAVHREAPPPWGNKPLANWGLLVSGYGYCMSLAGKMEAIRLDTLAELAAYHYILDATGQKISKAEAKKIAADMDFDYRSMLPGEMVLLHAKHQTYDFT